MIRSPPVEFPNKKTIILHYGPDTNLFFLIRDLTPAAILTPAANELPKMGRMVPELNEEAVRELLLYSYLIIYETKDEEIFVLAVVHQRKNLNDEDIPRD